MFGIINFYLGQSLPLLPPIGGRLSILIVENLKEMPSRQSEEKCGTSIDYDWLIKMAYIPHNTTPSPLSAVSRRCSGLLILINDSREIWVFDYFKEKSALDGNIKRWLWRAVKQQLKNESHLLGEVRTRRDTVYLLFRQWQMGGRQGIVLIEWIRNESRTSSVRWRVRRIHRIANFITNAAAASTGELIDIINSWKHSIYFKQWLGYIPFCNPLSITVYRSNDNNHLHSSCT